ncbi:MAG TPA: PAS domain S-box protein [Leptolyngbyaceae cyanobacterium M33_DOE_097]|nr:PAS domain S-box protein [Leptolyngbyaceae cyanobacterium M33_DOE_097]
MSFSFSPTQPLPRSHAELEALVNHCVQQATAQLQQEVEHLRQQQATLRQELATFTQATPMQDPEQFEAEVQQHKELLQTILDNIPVMIGYFDEQGRYQWVNRAWETTTGWKLAELQENENFLAEFYPDPAERQRVVDFIWQKQREWCDFRMRSKNGTFLDTTWANVHLSDGRCIGIGRDITQQKRADDELRESEARLQQIAANMPGVIYRYVLHPDGRDEFTYVSPGCREIWGIEPEVAMRDAAQVWQRVHPDDLEAFRQSVYRSLEAMATWRHEHRLVTPTGIVRWCQGIAKPEQQPNGEVVWEGLLIDISDRKRIEAERHQAEMALQQSEVRFRQLVHTLQVGVIVYTPQLEVQLANPKTFELLGIAEDQLLGKHIAAPDWQVLYPDGSPFPVEQYPVMQAIATGKVVRAVEMGVYRAKFDDWVWILVNADPQLDAAGNVVQIVTTFHDITPRKQAENALKLLNEDLENRVKERTQELHERERLIQRIAESSPSILYLTDLAERRIIYSNRQVAAILGYTPEAVYQLGSDFYPATLTADGLANLESYWEGFLALADDQVLEREIEMRTATGEWRTIFCRETVFTRSETGAPQQILGVATDVSDRTTAEAALQQNEAMLRQVTDTIPGVVYKFQATADGQMKFVYASKRAQEVLGCTPEQMVNDFELIWSQVVPEDQVRMLRTIAESAQNKTLWLEEYRIIKQGELRWIQGRSLPEVAEANDGSVTWTGILLDITERKQAEEQLKASLEEKELLLKEVHHRVKNNLQVVSSLFSLQSQYIDNPKVAAVLIDSQNRINAMALIHEKLYQSSSLARIDFVDYIHNLANSLFSSYSTELQRVRLRLNVYPIPFSIDTAIRCGLVINELVSNALKYAFPSGQAGEVCLCLLAPKMDRIRLIVKDNGIGLPADFQLDQINSLGLRLVKILTRKLKGEITITSQAGTTFQIDFPYPGVAKTIVSTDPYECAE